MKMKLPTLAFCALMMILFCGPALAQSDGRPADPGYKRSEFGDREEAARDRSPKKKEYSNDFNRDNKNDRGDDRRPRAERDDKRLDDDRRPRVERDDRRPDDDRRPRAERDDKRLNNDVKADRGDRKNDDQARKVKDKDKDKGWDQGKVKDKDKDKGKTKGKDRQGDRSKKEGQGKKKGDQKRKSERR